MREGSGESVDERGRGAKKARRGLTGECGDGRGVEKVDRDSLVGKKAQEREKEVRGVKKRIREKRNTKKGTIIQRPVGWWRGRAGGCVKEQLRPPQT